MATLRTTRRRLEAYANLLGPGSLAHRALAYYDSEKAARNKPVIFATNTGWVIDSEACGMTFCRAFY